MALRDYGPAKSVGEPKGDRGPVSICHSPVSPICTKSLATEKKKIENSILPLERSGCWKSPSNWKGISIVIPSDLAEMSISMSKWKDPIFSIPAVIEPSSASRSRATGVSPTVGVAV
jgi:hypothetical protein